jgi:hypothetical protein
MLGPEGLPCYLSPHPGPICSRQRRARGPAGCRIDCRDAFGHLKPERADIAINDPERDPQPRRILDVAGSEVWSLQLLLAQLGQRVQTATEQCSHLLSGHRVTGGQAVDPVQSGADPPPR